MLHDLVERVERFLVSSELQQRIARDRVVPRIRGPKLLSRLRLRQRLCESMLREIHDTEHAPRQVVGRRMLQRRAQDALGLDRQRRVGADACGAHERIRQLHRRFAVAGIRRDPLAIRRDGRLQPRATSVAR